MIALTLSFQELLGFLKKNLRKVPPMGKMLKCANSTFFLTVPRNGAPGIPIDVNLKFNGQTFKANVNAGGIPSIVRLSLTTGELFYLAKRNIKKLPGFVEAIEYNDKERIFHARCDLGKNTEDIELLAKLIRRLDGGIRLRIASGGE